MTMLIERAGTCGRGHSVMVLDRRRDRHASQPSALCTSTAAAILLPHEAAAVRTSPLIAFMRTE
jgi:hypothetical protein